MIKIDFRKIELIEGAHFKWEWGGEMYWSRARRRHFCVFIYITSHILGITLWSFNQEFIAPDKCFSNRETLMEHICSEDCHFFVFAIFSLLRLPSPPPDLLRLPGEHPVDEPEEVESGDPEQETDVAADLRHQ